MSRRRRWRKRLKIQEKQRLAEQFRQAQSEQRKEITFRRTLSRRAIRLRAHSTISEQILYDGLMARKMEFLFQYPIGYWIADFLFPERRLIVELDGGYHADPSQREKDAVRTHELESRGYRIVRFPNEAVCTGLEEVLDAIHVELKPRIFQGPPVVQDIIPCPWCAKRIRNGKIHRELNGIVHVCERLSASV